jgi:3-hydroxy-3-methylglutaryl CoA synthase
VALPIGIDDLNVYGSTLAVEAEDIVAARGFLIGRAQSLKLLRRSLPPSFEDPVTLAVNAAKPLVDALGPDAFGLLLVATESAIDYAKPVSSYVHRYLGLPDSCFHLETKHACFAGTGALHLAADWVRARPERRALVVTTDMVRTLFGHPAEPAEGAGSTAMVVACEPRLLELEGWAGFAAREVYDVTRPTPTLELVHAELSLAAYLDLLESAWEHYRAIACAPAYEALDYLVFHTPLIPLVEQAHRLLMDSEAVEGPDDVLFERKVGPSLRYCRELGNISPAVSTPLWPAWRTASRRPPLERGSASTPTAQAPAPPSSAGESQRGQRWWLNTG